MGRPLKIAKAQAVLTITATTASTDYVTVSQNLNTLGVIAGMTFVTASTVGGLTANTTYWILTVVDANNFVASATSPDANTTRTPAPLSDTTSQTVSASVGVVDAYFNNPDGGVGFPSTNANTYSVVGGNTAIIGPQVLPRVAIGQAAAGSIITDDGSTTVYGAVTDFTDLTTGTALQATDGTNLGFVSSIGAMTLVTITDTVATGSWLVTSDDATDLVVDAPVWLDGTIGGIPGNQVFYVQNIANTTHFNIATQPSGTKYPVTDETATTTIHADQIALELTANALATYSTVTTFNYANDEAGFILRQKGKQKYLVQGSTTGLIAQCYTANLANTALTPNTMNILATDAASATAYVQSLSDFGSLEFTANSGPVATGNIILADADPVGATFNTAYAANTYGGQPYPIVTISNA